MATTTNYSWTTPDNTAYVKDGASAIRTLGSSVDTTLYTALGGAYPGLRLVKTQTIGSGVSSVSVTGAFSATYPNYKIMVSGGVGSTLTDLRFTLTGSTTAYYRSLFLYGYDNVNYSGGAQNVAFWQLGAMDTTQINVNSEILHPFLTKFTTVSGSIVQCGTGNAAGNINGFHNVASSYTGFTLTPASGTMTGGTIYVYGYGAS